MSKLGLSLCRKLIAEPSLDLLQDTGLNVEMFKGTDKRVFAFITDHYKNYGKMPEWNTVLDEVEIDADAIPEAREPASYYADSLVRKAAIDAQREWMKKQAQALDARDPVAVIDAAKGMIREGLETYRIGGGTLVNLRKNGPERLAAYEKLKTYEKGIKGVKSLWQILDEATLGWQGGQLISCVARLGVGKTWWAVLQANAAQTQGKKVGFISPEMTAEEIGQRRDAVRYRLPYEDFKRGQLDQENEARFKESVERASEDEESDFIIAADERVETVADVDLFIEENGVEILIVDGAYLLQEPKAKNDWERVTKIIRGLKKIARKRKIPIIVLVQFRKSVKTGQMTGFSEDIAFTDAIGQDSDVVVALFQNDDMKQASPPQMTQRLIKNREGKPIEFTTAWDFVSMNFEVLAEEDVLEVPKEAPSDGGGGGGKARKKRNEDIPF